MKEPLRAASLSTASVSRYYLRCRLALDGYEVFGYCWLFRNHLLVAEISRVGDHWCRRQSQVERALAEIEQVRQAGHLTYQAPDGSSFVLTSSNSEIWVEAIGIESLQEICNAEARAVQLRELDEHRQKLLLSGLDPDSLAYLLEIDLGRQLALLNVGEIVQLVRGNGRELELTTLTTIAGDLLLIDVEVGGVVRTLQFSRRSGLGVTVKGYRIFAGASSPCFQAAATRDRLLQALTSGSISLEKLESVQRICFDDEDL